MEIFSNLAISLDGKIATRGREMIAIGSPADLRLLRTLRNDADTIVYGAEVLRAFRRPCLPENKKHRLVNAVLSRSLSRIDPKWPFFTDDRIDRILYVTEKIPAAKEQAFARSSEIVRINPRKEIAKQILDDLRKRKNRRVGVEGGGEVMWEFVRKNRIDEYFVTLVPKLIGGRTAPTLVDGDGFDPNAILELRLKKYRKLGDEIFLVYEPKK